MFFAQRVILGKTFQSTLPRRERRAGDVADVLLAVISIHAPAKGATFQRQFSNLTTAVISIHAPAKGATSTRTRVPAIRKFQSTLPRRERRSASQFGYTGQYHFNPRSREGSDPDCKRRTLAGRYFNPRSREGSDGADIKRRVFVVISIHAPVKGATEKP